MIFPDSTDRKKLTQLLRKMRRYNPIQNQFSYAPGFRNISVNNIIEDPSFRDSDSSYFMQAADLVAFLLYQKVCPNKYVRSKSAQNYFNRLDPIFCKVASSKDLQGIVWL
jgi:hypothetical protein